MLSKRCDNCHQTIYRHIYLDGSYQPACGCHSQARVRLQVTHGPQENEGEVASGRA